MELSGIASMAMGMKQVGFQQQVGVAVAKKAMDLGKQTGSDLALLLGSAATAMNSASPPGVGQNLDIFA